VNAVFVLIVLVAFVVAAIFGDMGAVSLGAFDGARKSVDLAISLIGYMALFLGLMKIAEEGGLLRILARAIRPIMVRLFPDVPPDHPAMGAMIMNIAANMLGLTNAATPLGIKAMQELNKLNRTPGVATNAMVLFLAINTSGLALLPSGAVSVRAAEGSADPWGIMASTLAATATATLVGIAVAKLAQRFFPMPAAAAVPQAETPDGPPSDPDEEPADSEAVQELMAAEAEQPTTWGVWVLRVVLLGVMALLAGPPLAAVALGEDPTPVPMAEQAQAAFVFEELQLEGSYVLGDGTPIDGLWMPEAEGTTLLTQVCEGAVDCPSLLIEATWSWPFALRHFSGVVGDWVIPTLILSLLLFGWFRGVKVYEVFVQGAKEGFTTGVMIIPYLVAILVAVGMFRASGAMHYLTGWLGFVTNPLGVPAEVLPMALVRPLSGSGAYGLMIELVQTHGPDSYIGYLATTLQGSTDTTFYVLAVYFGAVGVSRTRHAILAGLSADLAGFLAAAVVCALLFGHLMGG
jgi:spore maturation protein SpmA